MTPSNTTAHPSLDPRYKNRSRLLATRLDGYTCSWMRSHPEEARSTPDFVQFEKLRHPMVPTEVGTVPTEVGTSNSPNPLRLVSCQASELQASSGTRKERVRILPASQASIYNSNNR
jgi:hypothetical protein